MSENGISVSCEINAVFKAVQTELAVVLFPQGPDGQVGEAKWQDASG